MVRKIFSLQSLKDKVFLSQFQPREHEVLPFCFNPRRLMSLLLTLTQNVLKSMAHPLQPSKITVVLSLKKNVVMIIKNFSLMIITTECGVITHPSCCFLL